MLRVLISREDWILGCKMNTNLPFYHFVLPGMGYWIITCSETVSCFVRGDRYISQNRGDIPFV